MEVKLDKASIDAINKLRKAIEKQNKINERNSREFRVANKPNLPIELGETSVQHLSRAAGSELVVNRQPSDTGWNAGQVFPFSGGLGEASR